MTSPKKPVTRRDATGHLDPEYERKLLENSGKSSRDEDRAFIDGAAPEELSEELGEAFVQAATSGEDSELERRESIVPEETGGPFVAVRNVVRYAITPTNGGFTRPGWVKGKPYSRSDAATIGNLTATVDSSRPTRQKAIPGGEIVVA